MCKFAPLPLEAPAALEEGAHVGLPKLLAEAHKVTSGILVATPMAAMEAKNRPRARAAQ
eukprot:CAMPEP_0203850768 /NCGR_PEP_ID=MMETSP0359-20131031/6958_1 /ASSEMBLY_ACC=CAM_ASM_000338 /TAXON_ID=268821 /ORGANISM="Scrippsiella Hangoei, Strain SHTV-5" /LENGTH=58 /DNA_ID=CAMNT_0050766697 /DNA_START=315 /DNA_END=492 /DNA_ORIENTATION=-